MGWYLKSTSGLNLDSWAFLNIIGLRVYCLSLKREKVVPKERKLANFVSSHYFYNQYVFDFSLRSYIYIRPVHILRICVYYYVIYYKGVINTPFGRINNTLFPAKPDERL